MGWEENLIQSAYTTPSGTRLQFDYENVGYEFDKKGTNFDFPSTNGSYVQQLGNTSRRYPMTCYFWGNDCDTEAEDFIKGLEEEGIGKLEHPIYGIIDALPLGTIKRRDDLKTAANQVIVEVVFFNTIGATYPNSQDNLSISVLTAVDKYKIVASESFENEIDLGSESKFVTLKNKILAYVAKVNATLAPIIQGVEDVTLFFNTVSQSITSGIDEVLNTPKTLALQLLDMIHAPSKAFIAITDKINSYGILLDDIIFDVKKQFKTSKDKNDYITNKLFVEAYSTGIVLSAVNNEFETKEEALVVAEILLQQLDNITTWNDLQIEALGIENPTAETINQLVNVVDTGESYQKLQEAVSLTTGYLVQISFSLKQERSIILDRNRTIIDLCFEIYGSIDDKLDYLINTNNLSGSEILELPKNKEVLYYV